MATHISSRTQRTLVQPSKGDAAIKYIPINLHANLKGTAAGDEDAFEHLYDSASKPLFGFLRAKFPKLDDEEIEDLVHIALHKVWTKASSYRGDSDISAWAWIKKIAVNLVIDFIRRTKNCRNGTEEELERLKYYDETNTIGGTTEVDWNTIRKNLTPREWEVLRYWAQDVSSAAIAKKLRISPARVSQLLKSALEKIKEHWTR